MDDSGRSVVVRRNMLWLILLKGANVVINLALVPLTLGYLAEEEYGIWMTLSSMLSWISFFDIGLTNGLRNKLTEALAVGDRQRARVYVSTTLVLLLGIIALVFAVFVVIYRFVNWSSVFNTATLDSSVLGRVVFITIAFFGIQFVMKVVTTIYYAVQRSAMVDVVGTLGSLLSLGVIWLLTRVTSEGSLFYVAFTFSAVPVAAYAVAFFVVFYGKYRFLMPSIRAINLRYTRDLIGLGVNFFLVQVSYLILFTTSNFIISHVLGPAEVTVYNIAYKYFSLVTMGFTIILTPLWNAYTDAYVTGEFAWIRKMMQNTFIFWCVCVLGTVLMVIVSPWIYRLWLGEQQVAVSIPLQVSVACAVYVSISNWSNITAYFLNGVGKVIMQLYASLSVTVIYIPLALYLGKTAGIAGIVYALCIVLLLGAVLQPIQYFKIINQTAKGVWNK
jgi:O-antigen/teichoic acid export membrane protein